MPIRTLELWDSGPFDHIKFEFDRHVNVFVGPNNSGKSTVLSVLGDITVYPFVFPTKYLRKQRSRFKAKYHPLGHRPVVVTGEVPIAPSNEYWTVERFTRWFSVLKDLEYAVFVPALRESSDYRSKGPLSKRGNDEDDVVASFSPEPGQVKGKFRHWDLSKSDHEVLRARNDASFGASGYRADDKDLIQRIIELDYRAYREENPAIRSVIQRVTAIASEITEGYTIRFSGIGEDIAGLFPEFLTPDGVLPLNSLSQGTHSILHSLFQMIFSFVSYYGFQTQIEELPGILLIDEIDAHLHPSWQRRLLPTLVKYFPKMQIFCCTHSPLILSGLSAGQIQLLKREPDKPITVSRNEDDIRGWSVDEVLHNLLDIINPTDLGTEDLLQRLENLQAIHKRTAKEEAELNKLRDSLSRELVAGPTAAQIGRVADAVMSAGANRAGSMSLSNRPEEQRQRNAQGLKKGAVRE